MASGVEELLGMLYDMIEEGKPVTMHAELCKIDRDRALDLLDEIRAQFPVELGEARKLVAARDEYIASAKREAERTVADAKEEAIRRLDNEQLMRQAKAASEAKTEETAARCQSMQVAANNYCENVMKNAQDALIQAAGDLQKLQEQFKAMSKAALEQTK